VGWSELVSGAGGGGEPRVEGCSMLMNVDGGVNGNNRSEYYPHILYTSVPGLAG
jgi:hypothetical protein